MPRYKQDKCGYVFDSSNRLLLVTADYDNLRDIVTRIQLFLLEMDMDFGYEAIRRAIYSPKLFQNRFYFSLKLSDKYEG